MAQTSPPAYHRPLLALGYIFLRIGVAAFGGSLATSLPLIERELVTRRQWLSAADVTEALTYTSLLPGAIGPQVVAYLGYKLSGWSGSAIATAAFLFPGVLMMLALAVAYVAGSARPALQPAMNGLTAAIVGLLLAMIYRLGKTSITGKFTWGIAVVSAIACAVLGVHVACIIIVAGLLGIGVFPRLHSRQTGPEGPA